MVAGAPETLRYPYILRRRRPPDRKGVALHNESIGPNPGRCRSGQDVRALLEAAWEELPCYWNIDWASAETYANAEHQMQEMMTRNYNRAATIIWSVASSLK